MIKIFYYFKFIVSKVNIYIRYKKKPLLLGLAWIFKGKEISNFTYEIKNTDQLLHTSQIITNTGYNISKNIFEEIDLKNNDFKEILSKNYFEDYLNKNIFGRRMLWYILVRILKPDIVIESGVDKKLGSALLTYALFKNLLDGQNANQFIGIDISNKKTSYLNLDNKTYTNFKFYYENSLDFLSNFKEKKKIVYISDAEHSYDFEMREFLMIKNNFTSGSIIISDNNSGSLSNFTIQNNKKIIYFAEKPLNFWHNGGTTSVSFFY